MSSGLRNVSYNIMGSANLEKQYKMARNSKSHSFFIMNGVKMINVISW